MEPDLKGCFTDVRTNDRQHTFGRMTARVTMDVLGRRAEAASAAKVDRGFQASCEQHKSTLQRPKRCLSLAIVALVLLPPVAAHAEWSVTKAAQVDTLVERFLKPRSGAPKPPALSISIGVNGRMVLAKGFGHARDDASATAQTVYHIGSLTKQFTAAAMLRLIESGARAPRSTNRLTLDTPVSEIFSGVDGWTAPEAPAVTVRSLLTMTSNLPNFTKRPPPGVDPWGAVDAPKLFAALKEEIPHGWPNTFEYSNTGYFLLGHIIEAALRGDSAKRTSLRDYVRSVLLIPAGLSHTGFVGEAPPGTDVADPHYRRRPAFAQPHWLDGCGDMASNAVDLFAWNRALMEHGLLGAASLKAMFADAARVDPLTYYGMGWFVRHEDDWDSYQHSGSVPGFTAYNAILRRHDSGAWISVTLLTNSDGVEGLESLADDIFSVVRGKL
jgi:D-alanyl-D-alanine carboxypeptidase